MEFKSTTCSSNSANVQDEKSSNKFVISGVEIRHVDEKMGRGLFATKQFGEDEVIFEEDPIISCQFLYNKDIGYTACDHCLKSMESAESNVRRLSQVGTLTLPHPECGDTPPVTVHCLHCQAVYCSDGCFSSAWEQYHKTLCLRTTEPDPQHPLALLMQEWKGQHYPPETLSIMLISRMLAGVLQSEDSTTANAELSQFCHATRDVRDTASHNLLGESFAKHINTLRQHMEQAIGAPPIAQWLNAEGFQSLLALVGSNAQGIGSSPLSRWVSRCDDLSLPTEEREALDAFIDNLYETLDETVGSFLNTEGSGLFRLQSCINHSCRPNAVVSFPHNSYRLTVTALEPIAPGQQLHISYLDDCQLSRSRHSRHKTLSENYVFVCECGRCQDEAGQPDETSDEEEDSDDEDN